MSAAGGRRSCSNSRRQRVTGIVRVHDAPTLNSLLRTPPALGILFSIEVAVASRIAVDNATDSAVFGGNFRLDAAPAFTIARNDDRTLYRDAQPVKLLVILGQTVVHKDQRRGNVAIHRICVVSGQLL